MKKHLLILMIIGGMLLAGPIVSKAQIVVVRPHAYIEIGGRPHRPSYHHYWRGDEWEWRGGAYYHVPGRWEEREHYGRWHHGHWGRVHDGHIWHEGHWR